MASLTDVLGQLAQAVKGTATDSSTYAKLKGVGWAAAVSPIPGPPNLVQVRVNGTPGPLGPQPRMRYNAGYSWPGSGFGIDYGVVFLLQGSTYLFLGLA